MKITALNRSLHTILFLGIFVVCYACKKGKSRQQPVTPPADTVTNPVAVIPGVDYWLTKNDQSVLLKKQNTTLTATANNYGTITVDTMQTFQTIDGFGFTLTGGSAYVINKKLSATDRAALLRELFGHDSTGIGVSYLRISIGSSDLDRFTFSYDDLSAGETDTALNRFSLANDKADLIPLLEEIMAINPCITILATPWSPPAWMKSNDSTKGGSLKTEYYGVYAKYIVKYIQAMQSEGIAIHAVTPQNEPLNPDNNPSMYMTAVEEAAFIKTALGPTFRAAGITAKIIAWDHNCDVPAYPIAVFNDADASQYTDGAAFHLYAGDISALTEVHNAFPDKNLYFTEQYTAANGSFGGDLKWHLKNVIIGAARNWSRNALEWNLANDENFGPHTAGGCTTCKGALTVNTSVNRNVAYYIIAHASRFVMPGSVRIASNITGNLYNVAFKRPDGRKVLIVENDGETAVSFNISFYNKIITTGLGAGDVCTYIW